MKQIYKTILPLIFNSTFLIFNCFSQPPPGIEWQNTIGGTYQEMLHTVRQTSDGGYILGGYSRSGISGDKTENSNGDIDYWIVKTDSFGNIQWQNTIGGSLKDNLMSVEQTSDGGYILGGYSRSNISGDKTENCMGQDDYWMVKVNSIGAIEWQNTIGGNNFDYMLTIRQTTDGGYILGGYSNSPVSGDKTDFNIGGDDFWIVKTDSLGNIQWQNDIGGSNIDILYSILQTNDGGYILGGLSSSNISGDKTEDCLGLNDIWIVKTDSTGIVQWQNTIGGNLNDTGTRLLETNDGGYLLGGASNSNISGDKTENCQGGMDFWVLKIDSAGNIQWQNTIGGDNHEGVNCIYATTDGGYILAGTSNSNISGDKTENCIGQADYWIIKIDNTGNIQWQNTIGGTDNELISSTIQQTTDGGYILGGSSLSNISGDKTENCIGSEDYWIIKLFPDTITGIPNFQFSISDFNVYPNPITDQINIITSNVELSEFILYDIASRKILKQKFTNSTSINTAQLVNGIYIYEVRNKVGLISKGKVIKN